MRKLLFLLPLMALASCSGGDVLKSNRPFEMACEGGLVYSIDPELPQASMRREPDTEILLVWDLTKVTKDQIVLEEADAPGGSGLMVGIDRNTGKVLVGSMAPALEDECTFKAL